MEANQAYIKALELAQSETPNFSKAAILLEQAAGAGSSKALYALGSWYFHGRHFIQNRCLGIDYWAKAANLDNINAIIELGKVYERGEFKKKNFEEAFFYYIKAALFDDGQGCFEVSRFFYYGIYVNKNKKISNLWRDKSEELGYFEENE